MGGGGGEGGVKILKNLLHKPGTCHKKKSMGHRGGKNKIYFFGGVGGIEGYRDAKVRGQEGENKIGTQAEWLGK
jgi:hypothetical protein